MQFSFIILIIDNYSDSWLFLVVTGAVTVLKILMTGSDPVCIETLVTDHVKTSYSVV